MSTIFENKDRKVIPNFRSLKKTIELGELDISKKEIKDFPKNDIESYIIDFNNNKTLGHAGDLISAAIVNNITTDVNILAAAKFILNKRDQSTNLQVEAASTILNIKQSNKPHFKINKIEDFLEINHTYEISSQIKNLKFNLLTFDKNPFLYAELSRLYSIIGNEKQSKKNIRIAKYIAPKNRYILRSFSRLMAHFGDIDEAHNALRKNPDTKFDPWLIASEIAFSSLRNKTSNFIKSGNQLINSNHFNAFSLSELASSIGTVELINGSRKKSRSFFETALISPNDNSLAQVEWANNKENYFELDIEKFKSKNNFEALTLEGYNESNWKKVIENAEQWFIDMPFAKRPIMFGHHVSSFYLEDQIAAIKFCNAGLISNPHDPQIINNISYSYAMSNKSNKAFEFLNRISLSDVKEDEHRVCLLATTGLAYFRDNNPELGRNYYLLAMQEAKNKGLKHYFNIALMNYAREEILMNSEDSTVLIDQIDKIPENNNVEIGLMKTRIRKIFKEKKQTQ